MCVCVGGLNMKGTVTMYPLDTRIFSISSSAYYSSKSPIDLRYYLFRFEDTPFNTLYLLTLMTVHYLKFISLSSYHPILMRIFFNVVCGGGNNCQ